MSREKLLRRVWDTKSRFETRPSTLTSTVCVARSSPTREPTYIHSVRGSVPLSRVAPFAGCIGLWLRRQRSGGACLKHRARSLVVEAIVALLSRDVEALAGKHRRFPRL